MSGHEPFADPLMAAVRRLSPNDLAAFLSYINHLRNHVSTKSPRPDVEDVLTEIITLGLTQRDVISELEKGLTTLDQQADREAGDDDQGELLGKDET